MIDKNTLYHNLNQGMMEERYHAFSRNLDMNLPLIRRFGGLRKIVERFKGKLVLIIGAGPSLDKNLPLLKKYQYREELVIVATDLALRPLSAQGIVPGYVFSCETYPLDFFRGCSTEKSHLIAFSCMSNSNLRQWKGEISFYNWLLKQSRCESLWERAGRDLGFVATGSIITSQAVSFALGCGIRALALVGNDLAYTRRFYAYNTTPFIAALRNYTRLQNYTTTEINKTRARREYELHRGEGIFYTNSQFLAAKFWLEELFKKEQVPVYDCSDPGCSGKVVIKTGLNELFKSIFKIKKRRRK